MAPAASRAGVEITLAGMRFHAMVGILAHERQNTQPIEVDLTATLAPGEGVVDYVRLYGVVSAVMTAGAIDFLEQIGDRIAIAALDVSDRIREVRVAVRKPHVALGGPLDYAQVVVVHSAPGDEASAGR
jgi:dihydroneopterin aldolase